VSESLFYLLEDVLFVMVLLVESGSGYFARKRSGSLSIKWRSWPVFLFLAGILGILYFDLKFLNVLRSLDLPAIKVIVMFGQHIAKWLWFYILFVYFAGCFLRSIKLRKIAFGAVLSSALALIAAETLKYVFLRARPYENLGPHSFFNIDGLTKDAHVFQSLPSGHVAVVAGALGYLFYRFDQWRFRWLILLIPLPTILYRLYSNSHWPSDTFISMALGLTVGYLTAQHEKMLLMPVLGVKK